MKRYSWLVLVFLIECGSIEREQSDVFLWDSSQKIRESVIPLLKHVEFQVIKKYQPSIDGFNWLHGVALAWHNNKLYTSFGLNQGLENTASEIAAGRVSEDGGKTWSGILISMMKKA